MLIRDMITNRSFGWAIGFFLSLVTSSVPASQPADTPKAELRASSVAVPEGWFVPKRINDQTYMISMPNYFQKNVAYLIIGGKRAVLFDTGPGIYPIVRAVRQITNLPVLAIPSHLHYDHVGDLADFEDIGMLDLFALRSSIKSGKVHFTERQLMLREPYSTHFRPFKVTKWIAENSSIDLGDLKIRVIATPGHTPDSVTLIDDASGIAFSGDLVGERDVWALTRGAALSGIAHSLRKILSTTSATRIFEAHSEIPLSRHSLERVASEIDRIEAGGISSAETCFDGKNMKTYKIGDTSYVTGDLPPLATNNSPFDILDHPCNATR